MTMTPRQGFIIKIILTVGALATIIASIGISNLHHLTTREMLLSILSMQMPVFIVTILIAYRHAQLVRVPRAPLLPCLAAVFLSAGINLVMPGRMAELIKATYLRQKLNIQFSNGTAAIVIERLFDIFIVTAIGLLGFAGLFLQETKLLVALFALAVLAMLLLKPASQKMFKILEGRQGRFTGFIRGNCQHICKILTLRMSVSTLVLSLLSWIFNYATIWMFFYLQPQFALTWSQAAIVFSAMTFASAIPALPGGIGMVQAAVTFALVNIIGIGVGNALALSIGLHIGQIILVAVVAPIIMLSQSLGISDLVKKPEMHEVTTRIQQKYRAE